MTSPVRSVAVRLSMDPSSYIAGAAKAERSTLALDKAVSNVGPHAGSSMEKAAAGAGKAEGAFGKAKQSAGALGLTLGGLAGAGAAVAVGMSVKWAGDYQSALTKLATTAGESQKNLKMVGQGMLDMAGQVGLGADELAMGMYTIDSAGIHGADSLIVLKAAAQGARQEQADLGHVVDAVTTSLHDYHLPASDAAKVTSQLIAAVSSGKTTFDELTGAMHSVEPIAASAGMTIAQTAGALAAMTASGMHADQAAQNLASSIRSFEKPTGTMRDELYALGLDAQDLSAHLGQRGIAGTLQLVSEAIVQKMGPAGRVALSALNQNKAAAQDLVIMMKSMTPEVAKLSSGLLDGSVSVSEYSKAAKGLGGQNAAMALQFLGLYKSSAGFSQILKTGGPAVQTYIGALGKAVGTSEGLSVALQLTGENAAGTNKAIGAVAKAAGDAKGNIQGWDEVQGNFNQRLAEAEAGAKSLAIEAGQHLLPVLTNGLGWIHDNGPAALSGLESGFHAAAAAAQPLIDAGGGVVSAFKGLPGPMQEAVLALVAFKAASSMGFLDKPKAAITATKTAFAGLREEMALQQALFAADQRSAAMLGAEYGTLEARLGGLTAAESVANGGLSRLGAGGATVAARGLSALKSAGSGALAMLGGPWGVAMIGATVGLAALTTMVEHHDEQVKKSTQDVLAWNKAITFGDGGPTAVQASQHLDDLRQKINGIQQAIDQYNAAAQSGSARGSVGSLISQQDDLKKELADGTAQWKQQLAAMTPVEEAQTRVDIATKDLNDALKHNSGTSQVVTNATMRLTQAQSWLASETQRATDAQKSQIQQMQDAANVLVADAQAQSQAVHAQSQLNGALTTYRSLAKPSADDQATLADAARNFAQSQADAAVAQAKANGVTDTGTVGQATYLKALQQSATQMGLSTPASIDALIHSLSAAMGATGQTVGSFQHLGAQSDEEKQKLEALGHVIATLPDGSVVVTADTNPALRDIQDLLQYARTQAILYRATLPSLVDNKVTSGSGRSGLATGGWVRGPGTGTSDDVPIMGSNGEFMVKQSSASMYGHTAMDAVNQGRAQIVVPQGFASGGWIGPPGDGSTARIPVRIDPASVSAVDAALHAKLAAAAARAAAMPGGAPASVSGNAATVQRVAGQYGWSSGSEWDALYRVIMRESGFRNTAQNPTSTAYGMFQFLNSTWGAYGVSKTSDPLFQAVAGLRYIAQRYNDPLGAYRHEQNYGWYDTGGWLKPGMNIAMNGTGRPERVRTFDQEASLQKVLRSRERAGVGAGGSHVGSAPQVTVNARVFVGSREITDIARVEAEAVVVEYDTAQSHRGRYNP